MIDRLNTLVLTIHGLMDTLVACNVSMRWEPV